MVARKAHNLEVEGSSPSLATKILIMEKNEIRDIRGKKYEVHKTPCTCMCHNPGIKVLHIMACCRDGWKTKLIPVIEENGNS